MRLVTFETSSRQSRIGAASNDGRITDLNSACALYLRDVESENAYYRLAQALVPPNMRELFEGGDTSLEAAHKALDYALHQDQHTTGPHGEAIFYAIDEIVLKAPLSLKNSFTLRATFANTTKRRRKRGFPTPSCHGSSSFKMWTPSLDTKTR